MKILRPNCVPQGGYYQSLDVPPMFPQCSPNVSPNVSPNIPPMRPSPKKRPAAETANSGKNF